MREGAKTADLRKYHREYARMRRFLYRLAHPPKKRGVKPGHKFKRRVRRHADVPPIPRYEWDRT